MPATNELLQEGRYRISQPTPGKVNVFEAYDTVRNTTVVVREIPVKLNRVTTVSQQESLRLAFASQAKALTEIDHESLPHVHDFFSEIDRQYLVMESVGGDDLYSLIARSKKPFPVSDVTAWADQLLDALHYLHTHKPAIVHRNIRPQNVNLDGQGKIKLLNVGLESASDSNGADDNAALRYSPIEQIWPGLDAASQKAITNNYDDRSERILKEPLDARSDIYSLGATLYFLITGQEPVDPLERSIDILEGKLDPLREPTKVDPGIPSEISDVLMKALEVKRENRYDSAMIMRQVLKAAIARVEEREQEETLEQNEAAEIIRQAAQSKSEHDAAELAEQKRRLAEADKQRQAEQQRIAAEQRAEADRLLRVKQEEEAERLQLEQQEEAKRLQHAQEVEAARLLSVQKEEEAARAKAEAARVKAEEAKRIEAAAAAEAVSAASDESLLEMPVPAEVVAYREPASVDETELAAVLEELERADAVTVDSGRSETIADDIQTFENPLDIAHPPLATNHEEVAADDDKDIFSLPEKPGSSLPLPAIAGAIGLVIMLAGGGWFLMSGGPVTEKPVATPPVQVAQPAAVEPSPLVEQVTAPPAETETVTSTTETTEQPVPDTKTAPNPAKVKKAETKPQPEKKKAVTVDDLINDN